MPFGWRLIRVTGRSMTPLLDDGDYAVVRLGQSHRPPLQAGDVVLVDHPAYGAIVKCIGPPGPDGRVPLYGLSPESTSAEALGTVPPDRIRGRVRWRISPGGIARVRRPDLPPI